jgi:hypothetical protein
MTDLPKTRSFRLDGTYHQANMVIGFSIKP